MSKSNTQTVIGGGWTKETKGINIGKPKKRKKPIVLRIVQRLHSMRLLNQSIEQESTSKTQYPCNLVSQTLFSNSLFLLPHVTVAIQRRVKPGRHIRPRSLVLRLLLRPDQLSVRVLLALLLHQIVRERRDLSKHNKATD